MNKYSLVMLPGLDGTGIMFRPILRELDREVDPIVISYQQEDNCSYPALSERVSHTLPEKEFFILGESFSGPIALMLADRKPTGLKGIILCASFISNPSILFPSFLGFLVTAPLFSVWPVSIKANALTSGRANGKIKDLMKEVKRVTRSRALASRTRETLKVDVTEELRRCQYPILYLRGARDMVVTSHNLRAMKRIQQNISDVTIDASHLVLQEAPEDSAREILGFMRETT